MSVYHAPSGLHRAVVAHRPGQCPLSFGRSCASLRSRHSCIPAHQDAVPGWHDGGGATPGILPYALRASLWLFKIAPGDFVEPLDFMARLAALVPTPRVNLTRYHGVFAPNHRLREQVTPARRGRRQAKTTDELTPAPHVAMSVKRNGCSGCSRWISRPVTTVVVR